MKRLVIKLTDGSYINIEADCIDVQDGILYAWAGEFIVAVARMDFVEICYISEKK